MNSRSYKRHKIWEEPSPRSARLLQLIDIQKYLITAALVEGANADEWFDLFVQKTDIVEERWLQDKKQWEEENVKLIVCDIDDVLAEYAGSEFDYAQGQCSALGVVNPSREQMKKWMEEDGVFKHLPPITENIQAIQDLHNIYGYHVILMTSRRAWRVPSIQADTTYWLKKYNVPYEAILWGYDKAEAIANRLKNVKPSFAIENSRKHAVDIADCGIKTYWVNKDGEQLEYPYIVSVHNLTEIEELRENYEREPAATV